MLMKQMVVHQLLKKVMEALDEEKLNRKFKMHAAHISLLMLIRLGRNQRKCGGLEKCLKNRLRHTFTISTQILKPVYEDIAIKEVLR